MGSLVCVIIFFLPNFWRYNFFPWHTKPFLCRISFSLEISLQDIFSEITHKFVIIRLICTPGTSKFQNMSPVSPVQYVLIQICLATAEPFLWYTSVQGTLPIRGHSLVAKKSSHNLCPYVYFEGTPLFRRYEHFFSGSQKLDLTSIQEGVDGVKW